MWPWAWKGSPTGAQKVTEHSPLASAAAGDAGQVGSSAHAVLCLQLLAVCLSPEASWVSCSKGQWAAPASHAGGRDRPPLLCVGAHLCHSGRERQQLGEKGLNDPNTEERQLSQGHSSNHLICSHTPRVPHSALYIYVK